MKNIKKLRKALRKILDLMIHLYYVRQLRIPREGILQQNKHTGTSSSIYIIAYINFRNEGVENQKHTQSSKILLKNHKMIQNISKYKQLAKNRLINTGSNLYPNLALREGMKIHITGTMHL